MRRSLVVIFLILSALPVLAQTQKQALTPVRDAQAVAVLNQALTAMGGQSVQTIQDTVVQATLTRPPSRGGTSGNVTITTKGPNKMRFDGSGGGKTSVVIFNSGTELRSKGSGWQTVPSANSDHQRVEHLPALMLAYELNRPDVSASYVGVETLEGQSVHHVLLARVSSLGNGLDETMTKNSQIDVWLDAKTMLVSKVAFLYLSETDWRVGLPMEIFYDSYQRVNGLLVPFHQKCLFDGQPLDDMQITSFAVNQAPNDSKFEGR
jgi:hypothetical protein